MAGALVSQMVMAVSGRYRSWWAGTASGVACFALAVGSHLLLDSLPHYNWIVDLHWFRGVPVSWLVREALFTVPILVVAWYAGRDHPVVLGLGLIGSLYPDMEKVAYVDLHVPEEWIVFRTHSLKLSSLDGGVPHRLLIAWEASLVGVLLLATLALCIWRRRRDRVTAGTLRRR